MASASRQQPQQRGARHSVLCYGRISVINHVRVPRMPAAGGDVTVTADYYRVGGEALNVALPMAVWGGMPAVVGNHLGDDEHAEMIWRELERYPTVVTGAIEVDPRVRTPLSRILLLPNDERYVVRYWHDRATWTELSPELAAHAGALSVDAYSGEAGVNAARVAGERGLPVITADVLDPTNPLVPRSDVIIFSVTYLRQQEPATDPEQRAEELRTAGAGSVVLTHGSDPIRVLNQDRRWQQFPSFPLPAADTVGAGDIFKAGFIFGMMREWSLERRVRFGAAAAAVWVSFPPALKRPPTREQVETLLSERAPHPGICRDAPSSGRRICPLCSRHVDAYVFEKHWQMELEVVRAIRTTHPTWGRTDGTCPRCIQQFRRRAASEAEPDVPLLIEDHPIYSRPDLFVLPTPLRLHANPHYTGRGVTICFLDSGFYQHPALTQPSNRIVEMVDASTDDVVTGADFSEPRPESWHGLMTSAVAAGSGVLSNGRYAGIASDANLVLVKVSDPDGGVHEPDIIRGMRWVLANHKKYNVDIVNISVGGDESGPRPDSELNTLVDAAVDAGLVVVAAAGNAGEAALCPPASARHALTVGGLDDRNVLDRTHHRMYGNNWGRTDAGILKPEVIAPSIWLAAPILPGTLIAEQNLALEQLRKASDEELPLLLASSYRVLDFEPALLQAPIDERRAAIRQKMVDNKFVTPFYQHVDGTSFAAPIVASVVAQMLEANPDLTPARVKELLIATAEPLDDEPEEGQGYGVVCPGRAVTAALREDYGSLGEVPLSPSLDDNEVHFIYYDLRAEQVAVIGDFNDWEPAATPMQEITPGMWHAAIPAPRAGTYSYKFLVDGDRWLDDPENSNKAPDGYGGFSTLLHIPAEHVTAA